MGLSLNCVSHLEDIDICCIVDVSPAISTRGMDHSIGQIQYGRYHEPQHQHDHQQHSQTHKQT